MRDDHLDSVRFEDVVVANGARHADDLDPRLIQRAEPETLPYRRLAGPIGRRHTLAHYGDQPAARDVAGLEETALA